MEYATNLTLALTLVLVRGRVWTRRPHAKQHSPEKVWHRPMGMMFRRDFLAENNRKLPALQRLFLPTEKRWQATTVLLSLHPHPRPQATFYLKHLAARRSKLLERGTITLLNAMALRSLKRHGQSGEASIRKRVLWLSSRDHGSSMTAGPCEVARAAQDCQDENK